MGPFVGGSGCASVGEKVLTGDAVGAAEDGGADTGESEGAIVFVLGESEGGGTGGGIIVVSDGAFVGSLSTGGTFGRAVGKAVAGARVDGAKVGTSCARQTSSSPISKQSPSH